MNRFEIEDIVAQDKLGVVFRAYDSASEENVAVRRFFPFGQRGGGLNEEQAQVFETFSARLAKIKHESLRSVIESGVDPIDGIPFLVTEWIEGKSLRKALADGPLAPEAIMEIMRIALEVSIIVSHTLEQPAVWVEADVNSVIIPENQPGRPYTFWISPFHCLGEERESGNIVKLAVMGEELAGWKDKLVSGQAGKGLGGWFKSIRNNPKMSLENAHESLLALASGKSADGAPGFDLSTDHKKKALQKSLKQQPSKSPLAFIVILSMLIAAGAIFYYKHQADKPKPTTAALQNDEITNISAASSLVAPIKAAEETAITPAAPTAEKPTQAPTEYLTAQQRIDQISAQIQKEAEARKIEQAAREAAIAELDGAYTPEDYQSFAALPRDTAVTLTGTLTGTTESNSGKSVYLQFSQTNPNTLIQGVIHKSQYQGDPSAEAFSTLLGQEITLNGVKFKEFSDKKLVKITSREQITQK